MTAYPIETVSRPYRYKKTKKQTKTVEADENRKEEKNLREQNAILAAHVTGSGPSTPQGLGMKGSKLITRQQAWQLKHPEKRQAHVAVREAIRRGTLVRQPCADCGNPRTDAHHPDYSQPLEVEFLCRRHHAARHLRKIVKGPKG